MKNKLTILDFALVSVILALSGYLFLMSGFLSKKASSAILIVNGTESDIDISKDAAINVGENFKIKVKSGKIGVFSSDCPKQTCKHVGWISKSGESIVCVPKKILVKIKGKEKYDAVSR